MRIHIIFTGGTIGSHLESGIICTARQAPRALLVRYRERYGDTTDFTYSEPYTILSENLTFSHLVALRDEILRQSEENDAIIVTHGTDTLPFTASALSYLLGLSKTPVVLVSSNYVLSDIRANGIENLASALAFLRQTPSARGVFVAYQNKGEATNIHRASRLLSHLAPTDEVRSLNGVVATVTDGDVVFARDFAENADQRTPFSPRSDIAPSVLPLKIAPCMRYPTPNDGIDAILLETYHSGTLPTALADFRAFCADCRKRNIPLLAAGITGEAIYQSATLYSELGITPLPRMSPVAAYMKLYLALACGEDPRDALSQSLGGDF